MICQLKNESGKMVRNFPASPKNCKPYPQSPFKFFIRPGATELNCS